MQNCFKEIIADHIAVFNKLFDFDTQVHFFGLTTIGILSNDGRRFQTLFKHNLTFNSQNTAQIQEAHIFLLHAICGVMYRKKIKDNFYI